MQYLALLRPEKDLLRRFGTIAVDCRSLNCLSTHLNFGSLNFGTIAIALDCQCLN